MKNVKLMISLIALITLFATASMAGNVEFQVKKVSDNDLKYTTTAAFGEQISDKFGWTGFVLASNGWSEAYFGPTFKPTPWITMAVCSGIQNSPQVSRFAVWYSLSYEDFSLFHVMEDGDGRWHKLLASYDFGFGKAQYWDQDGLGRGPRVQVNGPQNSSFYVGLMFNGKMTNKAVGFCKSF